MVYLENKGLKRSQDLTFYKTHPDSISGTTWVPENRATSSHQTLPQMKLSQILKFCTAKHSTYTTPDQKNKQPKMDKHEYAFQKEVAHRHLKNDSKWIGQLPCTWLTWILSLIITEPSKSNP